MKAVIVQDFVSEVASRSTYDKRPMLLLGVDIGVEIGTEALALVWGKEDRGSGEAVVERHAPSWEPGPPPRCGAHVDAYGWRTQI
jgi:hypothetical protein